MGCAFSQVQASSRAFGSRHTLYKHLDSIDIVAQLQACMYESMYVREAECARVNFPSWGGVEQICSLPPRG